MDAHRNTPTLVASDPRGLLIRTVDYWRDDDSCPAQTRVHRTLHDSAGRVVAQWDPRLWALQKTDPKTPANLATVYTLSGQVVSSDSVDAGTQVALYGVGAQVLLDWDSRETLREIEHDSLLRPVAMFEEGLSTPKRCVERFMYGRPGAGDPSKNQLGQLVRHDDPAGSVLFETFAISGQCIENTRHFTQDLVSPDWPELIEDRTRLLEPGEGATSRWRFGPMGQVFDQVDARGNRQGSELTLDGRLRATHLQLRHQSELRTLFSDIRYNADGQVTQQVADNGVVTTLTYRAEDGRLLTRCAARYGGEALQHLLYDYDPMGNVLSIEDKALPIRYFANQRIDPVSRFIYDSLYQLSEATGWEAGTASQGPASIDRVDPAALSNYRQIYRYDESGNLLELTHVGARNGRKLKAARFSNRCLPYQDDVPPTEEAIAAAFDPQGNLRALEAGPPLTWSLRNQLRSVTPVERGSCRNDVEQYHYDGAGLRVRKTRSLQTNARGLVTDVRYLPGLELRSNTGTAEQLQVIIADGGLNSVRVLHWESAPPSGSNDHYRYSFTDHLGSTSLELGEDARIISQETFHPFGETAWSKDTEVSYKTIRYSGKERDATGLYYYGYRYYMPWLQRWLNPDPAGAIDGLNLYRMVRNNPIRLTDANGLQPDDKKTGVGSGQRGVLSNATNVTPPTRPAIPPRPGAMSAPARPVVPPRPPIPAPPATSLPKAAGSGSMAPPRPPPPKPQIDLGLNSLSSDPLPSYAAGRMKVGSHSLLVNKDGAIVAMRGDNRSPKQIREAGGFYPRDNRGDKIKEEFRQGVVSKKINTVANEHVRSPVMGYVSTGMDEASGGYGDTREYLYRMAIPGLMERDINAQTLGLNAPFQFTPKGRLDARLMMSGDTLAQSQFVVMIPPMTVEMTFITPIPNQYIVAYRPSNSDKWQPF